MRTVHCALLAGRRRTEQTYLLDKRVAARKTADAVTVTLLLSVFFVSACVALVRKSASTLNRPRRDDDAFRLRARRNEVRHLRSSMSAYNDSLALEGCVFCTDSGTRSSVWDMVLQTNWTRYQCGPETLVLLFDYACDYGQQSIGTPSDSEIETEGLCARVQASVDDRSARPHVSRSAPFACTRPAMLRPTAQTKPVRRHGRRFRHTESKRAMRKSSAASTPPATDLHRPVPRDTLTLTNTTEFPRSISPSR